MQVWLYTVISVIIVSLISLIGIFFLALNIEKLKKILLFLVSFAVGSLFAGAFLHLIPESFEHFGFDYKVPVFVLVGIIIFFTLEKFLRWRHCHMVSCDEHPHPVVAMNLIGDAVHNFIDGIVIGASYLVSIPIGITTTIAVILHEIPQEIGDFGILVYGKLSVKKALTYNFLSALFAIIGAVASLLIGRHAANYAYYVLPITAGGFIYIAGSDLIPELQHDTKPLRSILQFVSILLGFGIMVILQFIH
ncbi:MAG: ZIP family metal transporter [Candidatus Latescibacteria bacterium]|nr:ZIP family metal transporter [Candidatus Latescibacterota bacterium]